jgi:hypothetical protein
MRSTDGGRRSPLTGVPASRRTRVRGAHETDEEVEVREAERAEYDAARAARARARRARVVEALRRRGDL